MFKTILVTAVAVALLPACMAAPSKGGVAGHVPTTTTEPVQAESASAISDEDIDIASLDAVWDPDVMCPPLRAALDTGIDKEFVYRFAIQKFEEGRADGPVGARLRARLVELMDAC